MCCNYKMKDDGSHSEDVVIAELRLILQRGRGRGRPWRKHGRIRATGTFHIIS